MSTPGYGRALVVAIDKYHFRPDLVACRSSAKHLAQTFRGVLRFDTEVIWAHQVSRPEVLLDAIARNVSKCRSGLDPFLLYFLGRGEELTRDGIAQSFLALPTFIPGRTKSSLGLDAVIKQLDGLSRALIVVDAPVSIANTLSKADLGNDQEHSGVRLICAAREEVAVGAGPHLSPFSLCVDRAFRRAIDSANTSTARMLATDVTADLASLGFSDSPVAYLSREELDLELSGRIQEIDYPDWPYVVGNIYNWSSGSRGDGINDLHYLFQNAAGAPVGEFARNRLEYLSTTEPDPQLRHFVSEILNRRVEDGHRTVSRNELVSLAKPQWRPDFAVVRAGEFIMGTDDERLSPAEHPKHHLYLEEYRIAKHLITVEGYLQFVLGTSSPPPPNWESFEWVRDHLDHPVTAVTWHEASAFCRWLTAKFMEEEGMSLGESVRLPTEAEWEKAARGTDGRLYPWGELFDSRCCNIKSTGLFTTTPVGYFSPDGDSPYGCTDMVGNVREWTASLWGPAGNVPHYKYPYTPTDGRDSLVAPDSIRRVIRGGGYYYDDDCANCVVRNRGFANNRHSGGGFRIVVSSQRLE